MFILEKTKGIGPLVSSQEESALLVPVINRGSTAEEGVKPNLKHFGFKGALKPETRKV